MKRLQAHKNTDDEGQYRFTSLLSGNYYLAVSAEPWYADYARRFSFRDTAGSQKTGLHNPNLDLVYAITYYPNATDVSGAASIRVEAGGRARADMRLVPVPALHMRVEMAEADPQTFTAGHGQANNSRKLTRIGRTFPLGGSSPDCTSDDGEGGDAERSSGPLVLEVDGLRPGPSVVQVMTGNSRDARQPIRVSKSVPVDPTDGQTAGRERNCARRSGEWNRTVGRKCISTAGSAHLSEKRYQRSAFQAGRRLGREFQFFFR